MKQIIFGFIAALVLVMWAYFTTAIVCAIFPDVSFLHTFMILLALEAAVFIVGIWAIWAELNEGKIYE